IELVGIVPGGELLGSQKGCDRRCFVRRRQSEIRIGTAAVPRECAREVLPHGCRRERFKIRDVAAESEWARTVQVEQVRRLSKNRRIGEPVDVFQYESTALR